MEVKAKCVLSSLQYHRFEIHKFKEKQRNNVSPKEVKLIKKVT